MKYVVKSAMIGSEMTERILKVSVSLLEAFNDVRKNKSYADDNPILNYHESLLIFGATSNIFRKNSRTVAVFVSTGTFK